MEQLVGSKALLKHVAHVRYIEISFDVVLVHYPLIWCCLVNDLYIRLNDFSR